MEIVREYTDRISGVKARRPGLDEMMADARRGKFDVVLVWACDRIARSTRHFLEVLDEFNRLQVEFINDNLRHRLDKAQGDQELIHRQLKQQRGVLNDIHRHGAAVTKPLEKRPS